MNARVMGAVAVAAALLPWGGAHAATPDPRITLTRTMRSVALDAGYLVEVVCAARAQPATTTQVTVVTAVTCSIDGYSQTQAVPGSVAAVSVTSAVMGPFVLCMSGEATFLDPFTATTPYASRGPNCHLVHP